MDMQQGRGVGQTLSYCCALALSQASALVRWGIMMQWGPQPWEGWAATLRAWPGGAPMLAFPPSGRPSAQNSLSGI